MKLLKPSQVAALFSMSTAYIKDHDIDLGMTPLRTFGGQRRYDYDDVQLALKTMMERKNVNKKRSL